MNYRDPPDRSDTLLLDYTEETRRRDEIEAKGRAGSALSRRITSSSRSGVIDRNLRYEPSTPTVCPKCRGVWSGKPGQIHARRYATRPDQLPPGVEAGYIDCVGDFVEAIET